MRYEGNRGSRVVDVLGTAALSIPRTHWPAMLRGDCGYGNEVLLGEAESRGPDGSRCW
ncbi:MAG: hypothetical protein ACFUZC_18750 [Chthoniobacteraceae bacterium]